jgi:DNA polymerase I-like protein with 3'-5' exonuclease and polymerase domains
MNGDAVQVDPDNDTFDPEMVSWVFTDEDLGHCLEAIRSACEGEFDLETTGLFEHAQAGGRLNAGIPARIVLGSLTLPMSDTDTDPTTFVLPLSHPDSMWQGQWRRVLSRVAQEMLDCRLPLINQNVKFDARWIYAHTGVDLSPLIVWDNQMSNQLMDETRSARLKDRVPFEFGIEAWDDFPLDKPGAAELVPMMDLGLYAARDTYWTWKQARAHRVRMFLMGEDGDPPEHPESPDEVEDARLGRLATWSVMPSVAAIAKVEETGMLLDVPWVHARLEENQGPIDVAREFLIDRYEPPEGTGDPSFAATSHWFRAWAEKAVAAGDLHVASYTAHGNAQWTKGVLLRQARRGSEVAVALLTMRKLMKQNEFLNSWLGYVTPWDTIHSSVNIGKAATGRTSSSDPNQQNITEELRRAFIPRPGYVFADFDLSQIELRAAAFCSRSEPMMQAYREGKDLHAMLAAEVNGVAEDSVSKEQRTHAKPGNFGLLYGMGAAGLMNYAESAYDVVMSFEEAQRLHSAFFTTWDGIGQWHQKIIARAHQTGQVVSPVGRVRRVPDIFSGDDYYVSSAERQVINSPIQGLASDILLTSLALVGGTVPGYFPAHGGGRIVGTVHDSMMVELPEDRWEASARQILWTMTEGVLAVLEKMGCYFDVPLAAEVKVGTRWGLSDIGSLVSA